MSSKLVVGLVFALLLSNAATLLVTREFGKVTGQLGSAEVIVKANQAVSQLQNFIPIPVDRKEGVFTILAPGKTEKDKTKRFTVKVVSEQ